MEISQEQLNKIAAASECYADDAAFPVASRVVFHSIHEMASRLGEHSRHRDQYVDAVQCLFHSLCCQVLRKPCDCRQGGFDHCPLLTLAPLRQANSPQHSAD